ncbi:polysaccharide pyruvyl transferase family protein [Zafaria sp. J156]|uniref:polysaccharide pyruvyl transferase family protein n=1 Tax=Zafaria sp. J156 TaxID=3116490 RepID=UPI002E75ADE0|nr:polysaccharide pyruvyl transferase family protein [Zafaria sp. J156]MEE1620759.1 polysaccharide pyruvyl transferase family protein [Zafaria sp. J156]
MPSEGPELVPSVYWYKPSGWPNLGDELTTLILSRLYGARHTHQSSVDDADLVSVGSNLNQVFGRAEMKARTKPLAVVGSGFMHPLLRAPKLPYARIYSLRGFLSMGLLPDLPDDVSIGDPGLLIPRVLDMQSAPSRRFGFIPHVSRIGDQALRGWAESLPGIALIDFRTDDIDRIAQEITSCEVVLSQSLHGLILADALGVPNAWVDAGDLHMGGSFKFYDYFSSVGRDFDLRLNAKNSLSEASAFGVVSEVKRSKIHARQADIAAAFESYFAESSVKYTGRDQ